MDAALLQIKQLMPADGVARQRLMAALHKLAYSMESPDDTLHRYGAMTLQTACVKVGFDLGLFRCLVDSGRPVTVEDLAQKTGADEQLLARVLRYLAAIGSVEQDGSNQYAANHVTHNLAQKVTEAGVSHYFSTVSPQYQALPGFLKKTGYGNPTDERQTVFQEAWNTKLHGFEWFSERPENLAYFNDFMAARREPELSWLTVYPLRDEAQGLATKRTLFLNIGGGIGHQCAQFRERYPDLPGRVVLQDMAHTIAQALPTPGVENMAHDFFEPQPIRGAKFYYLRGVLHNHPPHKVRQLLERTKEAMAVDSVLLLDEMVLPEAQAHVDAASMDLTMLAAFAGMERTEAQWRQALGEAGLELDQTFVYNPVSHETVMSVRLPAAGVGSRAG